ncbi:LOB domain-containing protein 6-like [Panicum virgatum]|uniref:LOB domain-containing protein 6-like n=1 Tax=Panicum virgatum TaxID=38727 RepID=UPI0019D5153E|nr:LOB domain-containing protein 6-like [Panicum virgatum]
MPEDEAWTAAAQPAVQVPCAACRTLRRRCVPGCVFAPFFPAEGDEPSRFAAVHRVFGASNAARMLEDVERPEERRRAAETLVEEALARVRDPALDCLSYVAVLQMLNEKTREQVDAARAEIAAEFGPAAASEPVDLAAAGPEVEMEARAQAERALAHAEQDAKMLAARRAVDLKWRQLRQAARRAAAGRGSTSPASAGRTRTTRWRGQRTRPPPPLGSPRASRQC